MFPTETSAQQTDTGRDWGFPMVLGPHSPTGRAEGPPCWERRHSRCFFSFVVKHRGLVAVLGTRDISGNWNSHTKWSKGRMLTDRAGEVVVGRVRMFQTSRQRQPSLFSNTSCRTFFLNSVFLVPLEFIYIEYMEFKCTVFTAPLQKFIFDEHICFIIHTTMKRGEIHGSRKFSPEIANCSKVPILEALRCLIPFCMF